MCSHVPAESTALTPRTRPTHRPRPTARPRRPPPSPTPRHTHAPPPTRRRPRRRTTEARRQSRWRRWHQTLTTRRRPAPPPSAGRRTQEGHRGAEHDEPVCPTGGLSFTWWAHARASSSGQCSCPPDAPSLPDQPAPARALAGAITRVAPLPQPHESQGPGVEISHSAATGRAGHAPASEEEGRAQTQPAPERTQPRPSSRTSPTASSSP